jgi:hypothetical protein
MFLLMACTIPLVGHDELHTPFYTILIEQNEEQHDCPSLLLRALQHVAAEPE